MEYKLITDLAYTYIGLVTTMTKHYMDEGVPLIFNSSIKENGIDLSKMVYLDNDFAEKNKNRQHKKNDVVTVHTGDIGVSAIIPDALDGSLGFATIVTRIYDHNILLPEYLCIFLNHGGGKEQLYKYSRDARNNLNLTDYNRLIVPLPSIDKQYEIINLFNKFKKIISNKEQELKLLDTLIKSRFVEMFGTLHNNIYNYQVLPLQDVCEQIKDGTHQTPEYTDDVINGFKFLSSKDVTSKKIDWNNIKYIPESLHNQLYSRIAPQRGDILLAKNGTTGVAAIVDTDEIFDIYVSLALLRPIDINSIYLWAAINSVETKEQFDSSLKGVGVPNLHLGEIKKTKIIVAPKEKQNEFANFVYQVDKSKFVYIMICYKNIIVEYLFSVCIYFLTKDMVQFY